MWFKSAAKNKIALGKHSLECSEDARLNRYTDRKSGKYDGIHFYGTEGKVAYTESILAILAIPAGWKCFSN